MSISSIGSSSSSNSSLLSYIARQERIAAFQQEASSLNRLRNPVTSATQNTTSRNSAQSTSTKATNTTNTVDINSPNNPFNINNLNSPNSINNPNNPNNINNLRADNARVANRFLEGNAGGLTPSQSVGGTDTPTGSDASLNQLSSTANSLALTYHPNNGLNGNQFALLAARYDVGAQVAAAQSVSFR